MKIIDVHVHFSKVKTLIECAKTMSFVDYSGAGFTAERSAADIALAICMGTTEDTFTEADSAESPTPMLGDLEDSLPTNMLLSAGINPHRLEDHCLAELEAKTRAGQFVGYKIYGGYYHFDINDPIYTPVYRLAAEYGMPVSIHTGDTFSETALLEYAHPLRVDRLAVNWRDVQFVICHMGSPWVYDATEVAFKNRNVAIDLSGLVLGDAHAVRATTANRFWVERYRQAIELLNDYSKLMFGSDWPLTPMAEYVEYIKKMIPENHWQAVFYDNAVRVFRLAERNLI